MRCGWIVTDVEIKTLSRNDKMLCGHSSSDFRARDICIECKGTGKVPTDAGRELVEFMRWYDQAG
jgi:hypothetical protein